MSIRWKIFFTLLAFSLVPLMLLTAVSQRGTRQMGEELTSYAHVMLNDVIRKELQQAVRMQAAMLRRDSALAESALQAVAEAAEKALASPETELSGIRYSLPAGAFDESGAAVGNLVPDERFRSSTWNDRDLMVSLEHPALHFPYGMPVEKDSRLLETIGLAAMRQYRYSSDLLLRIRVSLASGSSLVFPGHGGIPSGFDPRHTEWYRMAVSGRQSVWFGPLSDEITGRLKYVNARGIFRPDGSQAGVVSVEILMAGVLADERDSPLSSDTRMFFASLGVNEDTGEMGFRVYALMDYSGGIVSWRQLDNEMWLASDDRQGFDRLVKATLESDSGFMELPFEGQDSLWAYAHFGRTPGAYRDRLIAIVPMDSVVKLEEQTSGAIREFTFRQLIATGLTAAAVIAIVAVVAMVGARLITRPFFAMIAAWKQLGQGDFSVRLNFRANDERAQVYKAFNDAVPKLEDSMRMAKSLELAHEVQLQLLPAEPPQLEGFDIAGESEMCDETGGDYYDFINVGEGRTAVVIGDVTGHGVASALLMATARSAMRTLAASLQDAHTRLGRGALAFALSRVNRILVDDMSSSGRFMSLSVIIVDPTNPRVVWARAGHDPSLLYDPSAGTFTELDAGGMVLGIEADHPYQEYAARFDMPGMVLFSGTDGIWEAPNESGERYGKDRLRECIRRNAHRSAREIINAVFEDVHSFSGRRAQDDLTMVVVKRLNCCALPE